jgi:hypothetical protein
MAKVIVSHHVTDFDQWYPVFEEHGEVRRTHGATGHTVNRSVEDPNQLVIVNDFATVEDARAFMGDPSLPDAMQRAGVDGTPTIYLVDEVEDVRY